MTKKNGNLTTILCTGNQAIISVAKSLLDEAGIKYSVTGNGKLQDNGKDEINYNSSGEIELKVDVNKSIKARSVIADLVELDFDE